VLSLLVQGGLTAVQQTPLFGFSCAQHPHECSVENATGLVLHVNAAECAVRIRLFYMTSLRIEMRDWVRSSDTTALTSFPVLPTQQVVCFAPRLPAPLVKRRAPTCAQYGRHAGSLRPAGLCRSGSVLTIWPGVAVLACLEAAS
jgi:hypothetical protein